MSILMEKNFHYKRLREKSSKSFGKLKATISNFASLQSLELLERTIERLKS